mmetsp:Transcript_1013/g.1834  ORF Transcript_1013/g.1834 Transcript_1013/m.1834 type:complete len:84 (+) Transcript_1013:368-619(+)
MVLFTQGLSCDIVFLYFIYQWAILGTPKSWRFPLALFLSYILRGVCVGLFQIRTPPDSLWKSPGFNSIVVSYRKHNDLYFNLT